MVSVMDDMAIRKVSVKLVGYGERAKEEFLVNIHSRNIWKYRNNSGA